ncbi:hypothetical protein FOZ61_002015 [Perkinsus olseni]|uniref:Mei2-like C-terminal RNA recognition motif domain-containing protein n=1 Tax=Perkinsus olseni TaxID=32597 RepID=A0A7J6LUS3_PEROL|nr:hypothetical protein FOZ61_002015 [Perkinsus olseni]KAF4667882.1 hypothetical protein FOL46_002296 [Perkinsus olseni]
MVPSSSSSPPSPASPPPPPPPAAAASGQSQPPQAPPSSQPPTTTSAPKFIDTSSIDLEQLRQVLSLRDPELLKHVETYIRLKNMLDRQARIIESALTGQQQQPHQQSRFSVLDTATSTPTALSVRPSPDANGNMVLVEEPSDLPQHHHHYQPQPQPITSQPGGGGGLMAMNGTNITGGMEPLDLEALLNNKEEETRTTLMMKKIPKYFTVFHLQQALDACCPYVSDEPCYDLLYLPADVHGVANRGFAFVNLRSPQHLVVFAAHVANLTFPAGRAGHGGKAGGASGFKRCEVYFARIQGREATLANLEQSSNSNNGATFHAMLESLGSKPLIIGFGAAPMRRSKEPPRRHPVPAGMDTTATVCSTCYYLRNPFRGLECACSMSQHHDFAAPTDSSEEATHFRPIEEEGPPAAAAGTGTDSNSDTNDQLPECAQQ